MINCPRGRWNFFFFFQPCPSESLRTPLIPTSLTKLWLQGNLYIQLCVSWHSHALKHTKKKGIFTLPKFSFSESFINLLTALLILSTILNKHFFFLFNSIFMLDFSVVLWFGFLSLGMHNLLCLIDQITGSSCRTEEASGAQRMQRRQKLLKSYLIKSACVMLLRNLNKWLKCASISQNFWNFLHVFPGWQWNLSARIGTFPCFVISSVLSETMWSVQFKKNQYTILSARFFFSYFHLCRFAASDSLAVFYPAKPVNIKNKRTSQTDRQKLESTCK